MGRIKSISCMPNTFLRNVLRICVYCELITKTIVSSLATCHPPDTPCTPCNTEAVARNVRRIDVAMAFYFYVIRRHSKVFLISLTPIAIVKISRVFISTSAPCLRGIRIVGFKMKSTPRPLVTVLFRTLMWFERGISFILYFFYL